MSKGRTRASVSQSARVDAYVAKCPKEVRGKLEALRAAIKEAAPGATETMDYFEMPGYAYPGYPYHGMFAWFGLQRSFIGLYVRPQAIREHRKKLAGYATTTAVVHLPMDREIPVSLVKTLVRASVRAMKARA